MNQIPSLEELKETLNNDFKLKLNLSDGDLKYVLDAFTSVMSAQFKLLYFYLSDIQNNIFPDTADLEANGGTLERQGRIYLNRNPRPATSGVFKAFVIGSNGAILRNGLTFKSNENSLNPSQLYVLDSEYILTGVNDEIEIRSLGGGTEFDLNVGDELTITEPVLGVTNIITISDVLEQPRSSENIEVYRQNILDSIQLEPQGGSKTDYRLWASDVQGVRKVYPYVSNDNAGVVDIYVESVLSDSIDGKGTPSNTMLSDVLDVLELDPDDTKPLNERGRRPTQAILDNNSVQKINLIPVDITIVGLFDSGLDVQNSISDSINNFLYNIRPYIAGADLPRNKNNILYQARLQSIVTDVISNTNYFNSLQMDVNGNTVLSYDFNLGFIPYLRNLNFV